MPDLKPLEVGVMFWAGRDPLETVREQKSLGVSCGQLGVPGHVPMDGQAIADWRNALESEYFTLVTCFAAYNGEDYADIPTVQRTVGFIPPATRAEREARTIELSDFAAAIGVPSIACHIGFVPEDKNEKIHYGIISQLGTFNPFRVAFHEWAGIFRDVSNAKSLREAMGFVFGPPGWSPDGSRKTSASIKAAWRARQQAQTVAAE